MITSPGFSCSTIALRILATVSGSVGLSVFTRMPRSAPMASPVRMVSVACCGPIETQTTSVAWPFSLSRSASSTAISSNGFIDIFTLASSTPELSLFTRILMSLSTTRLTGTRIFMRCALGMTGTHRGAEGGGKLLARLFGCQLRPSTPVAAAVRCAGQSGGIRHGLDPDRNLVRAQALEQLDAGGPDQQQQNGARHHAADVAPVGDLALGGRAEADELHDHERA